MPLGFDRAQPACQFVAIHPRHMNVGKNGRIGSVVPDFKRFHAVNRCFGLDAEQLKLPHQNFLIHRMVIDHEHDRALARARHGEHAAGMT